VRVYTARRYWPLDVFSKLIYTEPLLSWSVFQVMWIVGGRGNLMEVIVSVDRVCLLSYCPTCPDPASCLCPSHDRLAAVCETLAAVGAAFASLFADETTAQCSETRA